MMRTTGRRLVRGCCSCLHHRHRGAAPRLDGDRRVQGQDRGASGRRSSSSRRSGRCDNYHEILGDREFVRAMTVTFIGAVIFTAAEPDRERLAAYAFARLEFRGKRFWWVFCILPLFIPGLRSCSRRSSWSRASACSTRWPCSSSRASRPPSQMFFIRQFYLGIPMALEEAAMIDGASRWQIFTSSVPAAVAAASSWSSAWPRSWPTGTPTSGRS